MLVSLIYSTMNMKKKIKEKVITIIINYILSMKVMLIILNILHQIIINLQRYEDIK